MFKTTQTSKQTFPLKAGPQYSFKPPSTSFHSQRKYAKLYVYADHVRLYLFITQLRTSFSCSVRAFWRCQFPGPPNCTFLLGFFFLPSWLSVLSCSFLVVAISSQLRQFGWIFFLWFFCSHWLCVNFIMCFSCGCRVHPIVSVLLCGCCVFPTTSISSHGFPVISASSWKLHEVFLWFPCPINCIGFLVWFSCSCHVLSTASVFVSCEFPVVALSSQLRKLRRVVVAIVWSPCGCLDLPTVSISSRGFPVVAVSFDGDGAPLFDFFHRVGVGRRPRLGVRAFAGGARRKAAPLHDLYVGHLDFAAASASRHDVAWMEERKEENEGKRMALLSY